MAYIGYAQDSVLGKLVAESLADLRAAAFKLKNTAKYVGAIGPANLESHPDIQVESTKGQAFNDTYLGLEAAIDAVMVAQDEPIARLARGS